MNIGFLDTIGPVMMRMTYVNFICEKGYEINSSNFEVSVVHAYGDYHI